MEAEELDDDDNSAVGDAVPPMVASAVICVREVERDRGAETEVEADVLRPALRLPSSHVRRLDEGDEGDAEGDEVMFDLVGPGGVDSDGELVIDESQAQGRGGLDSEGSGGSGDGGRGESPALGEMGEIDGDDAIEVDGTVGGKRKR